MNADAMRWAMDQNAGSPAAKLVLILLADLAAGTGSGRIEISKGEISERTGLALRTVYMALDRLRDRSLVALVGQRGAFVNMPGVLYRGPGAAERGY